VFWNTFFLDKIKIILEFFENLETKQKFMIFLFVLVNEKENKIIKILKISFCEFVQRFFSLHLVKESKKRKKK
jgi:hypothetical protein